MKIKKGPFGYFAVEKFDDPERLCAYAEEVIAGNKSDFYLTPVTDKTGTGAMCYFEFSGFVQITDAEFSVFSPQHRSPSHKKETKLLSRRRRSVGDLFYTFIKLLDNLIPLSCIEMDPDMVFTDPDGISIKLCCLPVKCNPEELSLSSLGALRLEKLLSCDFFKSVITDDEKNALVYSVKENNEDMFLKVASMISGTNENDVMLMESEEKTVVNSRLLPAVLNSLSKSVKDLLISALSAVMSFILLFAGMYLPCFLLSALSLIILSGVIKNQKRREESARKEIKKETSRQRSSILFSDRDSLQETDLFAGNDEFASNEDNAASNENANGHLQPLMTGKLKLLSERRDVNSEYSVYLDETYIGSDCFLSDIVLDDPEISPLHAIIKQKNGAFYLETSKGTGKTFIEDSPVGNGKTYEIKSGQKITIGDISFRFALENAMNMHIE